MTNLVLNAYSGIIEIFLWVIVVGSGIAAFAFVMSTEENAILAVWSGIAAALAGFLFSVLLIAPLILLSNIRDQLKEVSDNTSHMSEELKRIR